MGRKRQPFSEKFIRKSSGGGTETFEITLPEYRTTDAITLVNAWNEDSAYTSCTIKYGALTSVHELQFVGNPQAGERITFDQVPIYIRDGYTLEVEFAGVTAADTLTVVVMGWRELNE